MFGSLFNSNTAAGSSWAPGWASQLYQPASMPVANSWGAGMYQPQSMGAGPGLDSSGLLASSLYSPSSLGASGAGMNSDAFATGMGLLANSMEQPAPQMQAPQAQITPGRYIPIEDLMKMMGATAIPYSPQRSPYG